MSRVPFMVNERTTGTYPRKARSKEMDVLELVLPLDRPGYCAYRELLSTMVVLGEGRRGPGNLVLGIPGDTQDITSPLPPVIAYGVIETTMDAFTVTVRECVGNQIDVEIVSSHSSEIPDHYEEKRRWTYSTWRPGDLLPSNSESVREVTINEALTLGIAAADRRILLHDAASGIVHLIPITNFHNELMYALHIRDPKVALNANLFFQDHDRYSNDHLCMAFKAYNTLKRRVSLNDAPPPQAKRERTFDRLTSLFGRRKT